MNFTHIEMVCNDCSATLSSESIVDLHRPSSHPRADWHGRSACSWKSPKGEVALHRAGWMDCDTCGSPGITVVLR